MGAACWSIGGESGGESRLLCGHIAFKMAPEHPLLARLPDHLIVRGFRESVGAWLEATLDVIATETGAGRPGGDLIALRLAEAIFVHALRRWIETDGHAEPGLAGFADPRLRRALAAIQDASARNWTVEALAREAGMSRTRFSEVFGEKIGMTPMRYLGVWRVQLACRLLADRRLRIGEVARQVGYASDSAFARVFRREVGHSPATYQRMQRR